MPCEDRRMTRSTLAGLALAAWQSLAVAGVDQPWKDMDNSGGNDLGALVLLGLVFAVMWWRNR